MLVVMGLIVGGIGFNAGEVGVDVCVGRRLELKVCVGVNVYFVDGDSVGVHVGVDAGSGDGDSVGVLCMGEF